jgi:uncharacterized protein YijF (DUF1287 family)
MQSLLAAAMLLVAAVPVWVEGFVGHYQPNGRIRSLDASRCAKAIAKARTLSGADIAYDPAYVRIAYPDGDVPAKSGVCADVIVRSFRAAGIDLQRVVHEDMEARFSAYPQLWGLRKADPNIDHRRVPNLMTYLDRKAAKLPLQEDFRPCDIVAWDLGGGVTHIGLVTDRGTIIHHIGGRPAEEDVLHAFRIIGHFAF